MSAPGSGTNGAALGIVGAVSAAAATVAGAVDAAGGAVTSAVVGRDGGAPTGMGADAGLLDCAVVPAGAGMRDWVAAVGVAVGVGDAAELVI